ncbi:MAG: CDP-alcohol phosphatidyltransferase family protein [Faecousia sp.]
MMRFKDWKREVFTIPNLLSLFRLVLIPVYITIYLRAKDMTGYLVAGGILAVSCLTDMIDGKIARKFNMISNLGKVLDPVADKATQLALILCLASNHPTLWYLVILFVVKEGFQGIMGLINLRKGKMLSGALFTGKVCTTVLFLSLILMVVDPYLNATAVNIICGICAVCMLITFGDYIHTYFGNTGMVQDL